MNKLTLSTIAFAATQPWSVAVRAAPVCMVEPIAPLAHRDKSGTPKRLSIIVPPDDVSHYLAKRFSIQPCGNQLNNAFSFRNQMCQLAVISRTTRSPSSLAGLSASPQELCKSANLAINLGRQVKKRGFIAAIVIKSD